MAKKKSVSINKKILNPKFILTFLSYLVIVLSCGLYLLETFVVFDISSRIIISVLQTLAFICFGFITNTKKDKAVSFLFIGLASSLWLRLLLPFYHRITVISELVLIVLTVIYLVYIFKKGYLNITEYIVKELEFTYLHTALASGCAVAEKLMYIMQNGYENDGTFPLSVLLGISTFSTILFIVISKYKKIKGAIHYVLFSFCVFVMAFISSALMLSSINYAFDFSAPNPEVAVITEADSSYHWNIDRHSLFSVHIDYEFTVRLNGEEFDINITSAQYKEYTVGDTIVLLRYKGALGVPYYTIEQLQ